MIDKIKKWFDSIPQDKLLHYIAGFSISQISIILLNLLGYNILYSILISMDITIICALFKEIYDKLSKKGVFDKNDIYVTILGGIVGIFLKIF